MRRALKAVQKQLQTFEGLLKALQLVLVLVLVQVQVQAQARAQAQAQALIQLRALDRLLMPMLKLAPKLEFEPDPELEPEPMPVFGRVLQLRLIQVFFLQLENQR